MKADLRILNDFPFDRMSANSPHEREMILVHSELDEDAIADGETDPYPWIDLSVAREEPARLIAPDEVVLKTAQATLLVDYPLEHTIATDIHANDQSAFTRTELVAATLATYEAIYRQESATQSEPTPAPDERGKWLNRPRSDGDIGVWGHDMADLGIEGFRVFEVDGAFWLCPSMCS